MAADIAKIPRAYKIFDTCLRQSSTPKIGRLKLSPDKSSTRCHSDLLPNCQRTLFGRESTQPNSPLWAQADPDKHLQGLQTTASIRLTKTKHVWQVDRQSYRQGGHSSSNLVKKNQISRSPPESGQKAAQNGDDRARTGNLRRARAALSQLSYIPGSIAESRPALAGDRPVCHPRLYVRLEFRNRKWAYVDSNHGPQLYQSCALTN